MNSNDEKLTDFFYDIGNVSYYQNSDGLTQFYNECMQILDNKSYNNINIQDDDGNTYLHYITKHGQWNWFVKLLEHGADPTIENKNGKNAFQSSKKETGNLWRMSPLKNIDSFSSRNFIEPTKNFALNFKEFLFNGHLMSNTHIFENISTAINFLKELKIDNDINQIKLVAISRSIPIIDKINWYKSNYSSPEYNTEFFNKIVKSVPFNADEKKEYYYALSNLLENKFLQTKEFNTTVQRILQSTPTEMTMESCKLLIKVLINQNFNLDVKERNDKQTLKQLIESNPLFHRIYLDEILSKSNKIDNKKRLKV